MGEKSQQMRDLQAMLEWSMQNTTPESMREYAEQVERGERPRPTADLLTHGRVVTEWDQLKACTVVLHVPDEQGPEVPEKDRVEVEDRLRAMENLEYLVENLDNANDLNKLDGIRLCLRYLRHHMHPRLRAMAAKIVSTCASNNEPFVKQALEHGVPEAICEQLVQEVDVEAIANMVGALSSLCTYPELREKIAALLQDFVPVLLSMKDETKVITRTLFFLDSLASGHRAFFPDFLLDADLLALLRPFLSSSPKVPLQVLELALKLCESIMRGGGARGVTALHRHLAEEFQSIRLPPKPEGGDADDPYLESRAYLDTLLMLTL